MPTHKTKTFCSFGKGETVFRSWKHMMELSASCSGRLLPGKKPLVGSQA